MWTVCSSWHSPFYCGSTRKSSKLSLVCQALVTAVLARQCSAANAKAWVTGESSNSEGTPLYSHNARVILCKDSSADAWVWALPGWLMLKTCSFQSAGLHGISWEPDFLFLGREKTKTLSYALMTFSPSTSAFFPAMTVDATIMASPDDYFWQLFCISSSASTP